MSDLVLSKNPACNPVCRACHYKDLTYSEQILRKQSWAVQQLAVWENILGEIVPAPVQERLAYRSKTWLRSSLDQGELSFGMFRSVYRSKTRTDSEGVGMWGCQTGQAGAQPNAGSMVRSNEGSNGWVQEFISWNTCPLHIRPIQVIVDRLRKELAQKFLAWAERSLIGIWIGDPHLVIISRTSELREIAELEWEGILEHPIDHVWFHHNSQVGKKVWGHRKIIQLKGPKGLAGVPPVKAFRQVAKSLLVQARTVAVDFLNQNKVDLVLDLYCGTGDLSLMLPPHVGWLGIELASEAVRFANTLRSSDLSVHQAFVGAIEHRLKDPQVLNQVVGRYGMYINPPRSGLTSEGLNQIFNLIQRHPPAVVVYLSCSASSLARDLNAFLKVGYSVEFLQPYDFFPQTEHFETLAVLRRQPE